MLQAIKKAIAKLPVLIMAAVLALSVAGAAGNARGNGQPGRAGL